MLSLRRKPNKGPWSSISPSHRALCNSQRDSMPICLLDLTIQTDPRAGLRNSGLTSPVHIMSAALPSLQLCRTHFSSRETASKLYCRRVSSALTLVSWIGVSRETGECQLASSFSVAPNCPHPCLLTTGHIQITSLMVSVPESSLSVSPCSCTLAPFHENSGILSPFHRWGNWVTERFSDLSAIPNEAVTEPHKTTMLLSLPLFSSFTYKGVITQISDFWN